LKTIERREYVLAQDVLRELKEFLSSYKGRLDCITFSGSGEPTLNSHIAEIIEGIKRFTDKPIVVLTGGALLINPSVRKALLSADIVVPTLTTTNQEAFKRIHRPAEGLSINDVIEGYVEFKNQFKGRLEIEFMVLEGFNDCAKEIDAIRDALERIKPDKVQMNTVRRPPSEKQVKPVSLKRLREIGESLGFPFSLPERKEKSKKASSDNDRLKETVLDVIKRRSVTFVELKAAIGADTDKLKGVLSSLLNEGLIIKRRAGGQEFYILKEE